MQQSNLPANSQFLTPGTAELKSKSPKNGGQAVNVENDWDVWLPMLPQLDELPWTLQDISKVLRLGRTRENFRAISPQVVERVSFLLQRPLLRIVREVKRLSVRYSKCSKEEIQTSIRLVLSLSMAKTCLTLASKAFSLYTMSSDRFRRSKRSRSGLVLSVGRMFRWLVNMKVAARIYDAAAIYLSATLEYIAEELVFRAVNNLGNLCYPLISHANQSCEHSANDNCVYLGPLLVVNLWMSRLIKSLPPTLKILYLRVKSYD